MPVQQSTILFLEKWTSTEGPKDFSIQSYRKAIIDLVDTFLSDLEDVAQTLQSSGNSSGSLRSLNMCLEFLGENSEIFLQVAAQHVDQIDSQVSVEEHTSHAFCFWFLRHLIRLLSEPDCEELHDIIIKLIENIIQSIKMKNKYVFKQSVSEFINICKVLITVSNNLHDGKNKETFDCFSCDLNLVQLSLRDPPTLSEGEHCSIHHISNVKIILDDADHCELLQVNIVKLLLKNVPDISLFGPTEVQSLWGCFCCHLEDGDLELKKVTLEGMAQLLDITGPPPITVVDYFLSCTTSLWELLCLPESQSSLLSSEKRELEKSAARLLMSMVMSKDPDILIARQTFFRNIIGGIVKTGIGNISSTEGKQALAALMSYQLKAINVSDLFSHINRPFLDLLTTHLISVCGMNEIGELVTPILVELALLDAQEYFLKHESNQPITAATERTPARMSGMLSRKRKFGYMRGKYELPTFRVLQENFNKIFLEQGQIQRALNVSQIVMAVAAFCSSEFKQQMHRVHLLDEGVFIKIISCWTRYLTNVCSKPDLQGDFLENYHSVLWCFALIFSVNDICPVSAESLQECTWIVSLPWLVNDLSWKDLKPKNPKDCASIASKLVNLIDDSTMQMCLKVLSLMPKDAACAWRTHVVSQALTHKNLETRKTVIKYMPVLLKNSGPKNSSHLIEQLLLPLLEKESEDLHKGLAEIFGDIAAVIAEVANVKRTSSSSFKRNDLDPQVSLNPQFMDSKDGKKSCKALTSKLITPFQRLLKSSDPNIRRDAYKSLHGVFLVVDMDTESDFTKHLITSALPMFVDEDFNIRVDSSLMVPFMLTSQANNPLKKPSPGDQLLVDHLKGICFRAHDQNNSKLQETALLAVGQVGRKVDGKLLEECIVCLLENRLNKHLLLDATAFEELQDISAKKNEPLQHMYVRFKKAICKFLAEALYTDQQSFDGVNAKNILINIASTLGAEDLKSFLQGCEKHLLPFLVSKASPDATKLIKLLASLQSPNVRRTLLINNTKYIFAYLVCFCQKQEMEKALLYLQAETDFSLGNLLRLDFQRVHNELLLHLSSHYQQVFNGLKILASNDEQYKGPKDINSSELMATYLEPRLLGVLAFFDSQLMNSNITLDDKELALRSLISIIRLMGCKHISSIRHKVMNTLRLGLQFTEKSFIEISCKAWNCFVQSLELPLLGIMMSQIIATLLPLLQSLPQGVAHIINYMIVDNRAALRKHFHEIYFLPDIPELTKANAILKQHGESNSRDPDLKTSLAFSIKGINHESLDVRVHALSKLGKILQERRMELKDYMLNSEQTDPIISELISALLSGCRETHAQTQCLYGKCLGQLGAVDPGRLEVVANGPVEKKCTFHASIEDESFAISLINVVVKAFLAATEPRIQDCSAFALQELLQIYEISSKPDSQEVNIESDIWKGFPEQTQEILVPLLTSKYRLKVETKWANYPHPIYGSEKGKHFKDWVSNWTGYLISKVKSGKACQVFAACIATKRHNTQVALHILPHVVLQVLLDGTKEDMEEILAELLEVLHHMQKTEARLDSPSNFHQLSGQTVFSILDFLTMWRNNRIQIVTSGKQSVRAYEKDTAYQVVNAFLEKIPQEVFAKACFNCKAYTRALRHFEHFVNANENIQQHLDFLQRLFKSLDEPDGVLGVAAIRQSQPTLMQQILTHESLGQQQDAQACYERAIQMESEEISHHHGLLRSLIDLAQPNKALIHTSGILADRPRWTSQLNSYKIEAAWKLGSWDKLDEALRMERQPNTNWPVLVGRILMEYKEKNSSEFIEHLELARKEQMGPLSAASMEIGSYHRGYENILRLHMINEIEEFFQVLVDFPPLKDGSSSLKGQISSEDLLTQWQARLQIAQSSFRTQEPILTLRRTLLSLIESERDPRLDMQIGKWWLWSAKVARKAGYLQSAYGCLLQASSYHLPEFFLEKAKWLWDKGENDAAISCLDKGITDNFGSPLQSDRLQKLDASHKEVFAQSLLLYGRYGEETSNLETNSIMKQYRDVIEICPEWEDGYFHLAKFYDRIMTAIINDKEKAQKQGEFIIQVVNYFGLSLKYGNKHIYQSLPRLLSLWLDYGTTVAEAEKKEKGKASTKLQTQCVILKRINHTVKQLSQQLAPYQMFTAFPQLISRICHAQPDVFQQLQEIMADLLVQYPQQAMWMMMAVSKSSYAIRVQRCQEIFSTAILKNKSLSKFIQDGKKLTERLLELCEKDFGNVTTVSLNQMFKPLKRLLEDRNFSKILLPLQSSVTVKLPAYPSKMSQYNPFPDNQVYIQGFGDSIEIITSLQKPKKITMIGSDGRHYVMMCKPKDDLRKDCRLMEFNTIVNKFLRRDAESRRRHLLIRTYTVTPLNEECGLIEWVNNTTGLRHILVTLYKEKGVYMSGKELKAAMPTLQSSPETKLKIFKEKLLPRHPPLFPEWFMRTFPDPTSWYNARVSFARTAAVMSIVGYILGLGDRHGENILFDSTTGDCVHVDFNCLFNKGETFEWPERVPFRLTHNMSKALGPMGFEGLFRRACEVTLKVIRDQMDPLMSVLKPFVYDPLVEWSKPSRGQRSNNTDGEINNELALNHVQNIEHRMRGILKSKTKPKCLPLSIEGHVNYLIQEATDEKNLSEMYIGWAAYM